MKTKQCKDCKEIQSLDSFCRHKAMKDGRTNTCKSCKKKYLKDYWVKNKSSLTKKKQQYYFENKEKILEQFKEYHQRPEVKVRQKEHMKEWYIQHREDIDFKEKRKEYRKEYNSRPGTKEKWAKRQRNLRQTDPQYKLACDIRRNLSHVFMGNFSTGKCVEELGCTSEFLRSYLESRFYAHPETGEEMTLLNKGYNGWHVHHVQSLNSFNLEDSKQRAEACHWTNLLPWWKKDHRQVHAGYSR